MAMIIHHHEGNTGTCSMCGHQLLILERMRAEDAAGRAVTGRH
jgi:hypothetical protein